MRVTSRQSPVSSRASAAASALHITRIVRARAMGRIVGEFYAGASVRALVKKWRLNATGVEDVIRTAFRA